MPYREEFNPEVQPDQMLVLGRGIEPASSAFAGQVIQDSPESGGSYGRAVAAAEYAADHPVVSHVTFSGLHTFVMAAAERPGRSEAEAMRSVAMRSGIRDSNPMVKLDIEDESQSTYGNFVWSYRRGFISAERPLAVVTHQDHLDRAMDIGKQVLPHTELLPIVAVDENFENTLDHSTADKAAKAVYKLAMLGVEDGDVEAIGRRDELVHLVVGGLMRGVAAHIARRRDADASAS